jgi:hypothetical protein
MAGLIGASSLAIALMLGAGQPAAPPAGTFTITGRVVHSSGPVPAKLTVMVNTPTSHGSTGESCERTPDGQFTARGLRPGTYLLEATPSLDGPDDHGTGYERGFAVVNVKDADVSGVIITTARGVTVRGRVRFDESRPGSARPPLIVVHAALAVTEWQGPGESGNVSEDGTFELHDVRGPRIFRFGWQLADRRSYWIPGPILLDGQDITNVPVDFSREPAGDLVVVFKQKASAIVGRLEDIAGLPASGCVAMLPEDPDLQRGWSTAVGAMEVGARGRFYFTNMPPGEYFLAALDGESCPTPNLLIGNAREIARRATRVMVTDGATIHAVVTTSTATPQP